VRTSFPAWTLRAFAFAVCFLGSGIFFWWGREDLANRLGYTLWLWASPEDRANFFRLLVATAAIPLAVSLLAGIAGAIGCNAAFRRKWRGRLTRRLAPRGRR
jgi:hypothetical protein